MALFFLGFWVFAGFIPPPAPGNTPQQIASVFAHNRTGIRVGLVLTMFASALLCLWFAVISVQLGRIEGRRSPWAYAQMIAGAATVLEFIFPLYRSERSLQTVQTLNDLAWLPFLGIVSTALIQGYAIGIAILADKRVRPVFPRWLGYFQFWCVTLLVPGALIVFFKHGPFAWNGLLAWWLVLVAYFLWITVTSIVLIGVVKRDAADDEIDAQLTIRRTVAAASP
jgi:hypothetical protein